MIRLTVRHAKTLLLVTGCGLTILLATMVGIWISLPTNLNKTPLTVEVLPSWRFDKGAMVVARNNSAAALTSGMYAAADGRQYRTTFLPGQKISHSFNPVPHPAKERKLLRSHTVQIGGAVRQIWFLDFGDKTLVIK